jgi:phage tail-like protein
LSELRSKTLNVADGDWNPEGLSPIIDKDKNKICMACETAEGTCKSPTIDSGLPGCRWHCIDIDADIPKSSSIEISLKISEDGTNWKKWPGSTVTPEDLRYVPVRATGGRYLSLEIKMRRGGEDVPVLRNVSVNYPRPSYLNYLPAVFQNDSASRDFLERFLSIFESEMYDLEETIANVPVFFDPSKAPERFVPWLAEWVSLDLYQLLRERNREYILRAMEFYKQKGTVNGLASLVSFLTGKECCVKEYMNNVFRSYGREHEEAEEIKCGKCRLFYHKTSTTLKANPEENDILGKMGTYLDEVHYTVDTSAIQPDSNGRIHPNVIGIFIILPAGERLEMDEKDLLKIIESFLPIFVVPKIFIEESPWEENLSKGKFSDSFWDQIQTAQDEKFKKIRGNYRDSASWKWLLTYMKSSNAGSIGVNGITNDPSYRTVHSGLDIDLSA